MRELRETRTIFKDGDKYSYKTSSHSQESKDGKTSKLNIRTLGTMAYRNADRFHKIKELITKNVYTIAIVGKPKEREWGYSTENGFVDHDTYRKNKRRI